MAHYETNRKSITAQLDTRYADETISEVDKIWYLTPAIESHPWESILISLISFQMPNSMYIINSTNNKLVLTFDGYGDITLTSPDSNYTADQLADWVTDEMSAYLGDVGTVVCTFSYNTLKFTISSTTTNFYISSDTTIYYEMGFTDDMDGASASTITSSDTLDLSGPYNIYVKMNNLNIGNLVSNNTISNCIAQIPIDSIQGDIIFYAPAEPIYYKVNARAISKIHMTLVDGTNTQLQINGAKWSCKLAFHYQNKRPEMSTNEYYLREKIEEEELKESEKKELKKSN